MPKMTILDPETGGDLEVPAVWEICEDCRGDGYSSAYLGVYTQDDLAELGVEWVDEYRRGLYDRTCDECSGSGKVLLPDEERLNFYQRQAWEAEQQYRTEIAWEKSMRAQGIQF